MVTARAIRVHRQLLIERAPSGLVGVLDREGRHPNGSQGLAEELDGVRAIRVFPGAVRTPLVEAMLNSPTDSPARQLFCQLDTQGHIADVSEIGEWIADLLVETSDVELDARETWHFGESM